MGRNFIARLNADGSLDTTFLNGLAGANSTVRSVAVQPDGRALVGGDFGGVNNVASTSIARLYAEVAAAPAIATQPSNQTSYDACCAVFQVEATGSLLDYRWRKDGVDLFDGGSVSGAASPTLTLTGVSVSDAGAYSVVVSNFLGSETSDDATLSIATLPQCQLGICDPELGCVLSAGTDGTSCDDANTCTGVDTCLAGACQSTDCLCITAPDGDGDGFGDAGSSVAHCDANVPPGHVANAGDCDDASDDVHPGATEICDALRNDCDGADWPALLDTDRDVIEDACDNCVSQSNPTQANSDTDGFGNACDNCKLVANDQTNSDTDLLGDACDNCDFDANDGQGDADGDSTGDACTSTRTTTAFRTTTGTRRTTRAPAG